MEGFLYNDKAINSSGDVATIVYLPDANASVEILVYERNTITLSGGAIKGMSLTGDISKLIIIGQADTGLSLDVQGSLTRSQVVQLGEAATGLSWDLNGALITLSLFPFSSISKTWDVAGEMVRVGTMVGATAKSWVVDGSLVTRKSLDTANATIDVTLSGVLGAVQYLAGTAQKTLDLTGRLDLYRPNYIGYSSVSLTVDVTGSVYSITALQGNSNKTLELTGSMAATKFLAGNSLSSFDVTGFLSNNASVQDLTGFVMTRRTTNREMTR